MNCEVVQKCLVAYHVHFVFWMMVPRTQWGLFLQLQVETTKVLFSALLPFSPYHNSRKVQKYRKIGQTSLLPVRFPPVLSSQYCPIGHWKA